MRVAIFLVALAAAVLPASAQSVNVERIDVVDRGIYEIVTGAQTPGANTPTGTVTATTAEKLVTATTTIPGKVGVEFGFHYVVAGLPKGAEAPLDFAIAYPPPGLKDPAAAAPMPESKYSRPKKIGDTIYLGYGFENAWEIVPGTWTFTISSGGKKLAEQSFTVTKP
ncbi:hypothetical protein BH10PSE9_BH10PSE9_15450 [soil metagenome]